MKEINHIKFLLIICTLFSFSCNRSNIQKLELQPLFSNNMVIQQEQQVPIWGTAKPNSSVKVSFRNQRIETIADKDGKWIIKLEAETSGTNDSLIAETRNERCIFNNVAVGEVWLASGQSNMEVSLINNWAPVNNAVAEVEAAKYPNIRFLLVTRNTTINPVDTIKSDGWISCSPETAGKFSAVAYFFARHVHNKIQVPVGIIQSAWGGTVAQAWTTKESLSLLKDFAGEISEIEALPQSLEERQKQFDTANLIMHQEISLADEGINKSDSIFKSVEFDDSNWKTMHLPGKWEETHLGEFDGSVWFRKQIIISEEYEGTEMTLNLAPVDDFDEAWVNGNKIGNSNRWESNHQYVIPGQFIKRGENIITLRISDLEGGGGYSGKDTDFFIATNSGFKIDISGEWKMHPGYNLKNIETQPISPFEPNRVTTLFNGMINPIIPYAIKGVIWYQGESNTYDANQYSKLFPCLINDWREHWNIGDFPFYFVQLPNYMKRNAMPTSDDWTELREAQTKTLNLPNTGMAVTIDIGNALNIHPGNKQDVGLRLALLALNKTYQFDIAFSGPIYKNAEINKNKIIISFDNTYNGLQTSDNGKPTGFAIAGDNQKYYWAEALIVNNQVILSSDKVKNPKTVRYAWSANPECNLINSEGLPTRPFSTDNFQFSTE